MHCSFCFQGMLDHLGKMNLNIRAHNKISARNVHGGLLETCKTSNTPQVGVVGQEKPPRESNA